MTSDGDLRNKPLDSPHIALSWGEGPQKDHEAGRH